MNHNRLFQIILDFIDEYGLPSDASVSAYPEYGFVTVMVPGRGDDPDIISDHLLWNTDSNGITLARITFDGIDFTVQVYEADEQVVA